ncbi:hypothetical protein ACIBH1_12765 [Nonomuraea sp. NPDC050663]|uniref:RNA polymerase subunit sigma-70 n=1 Tax=Nonomuraea soli TaxID=1032476 RepID=A0A7W0CH67_9ACTN|nr:hypothetical protein [Nonomuraea soli]MBA2891103.1 hypothetical protein [Nonomuraea soli]NUT39794.1 hypothetical protein [Thermoactinospora sp.]
MSNDLTALVQQTEDEDPLRALQATRALRAELERIEAVHVRRARVAGLPWAQIADALQVSKQAVHKKYGRR